MRVGDVFIYRDTRKRGMVVGIVSGRILVVGVGRPKLRRKYVRANDCNVIGYAFGCVE